MTPNRLCRCSSRPSKHLSNGKTRSKGTNLSTRVTRSHRSEATARPVLVNRRRRGIDRIIGLGDAHLGNFAKTVTVCCSAVMSTMQLLAEEVIEQSSIAAVHESASLIGQLGSSAFRLSTAAASMSLAGSCFSPESAHRPFHHGIRRRGGTIF